MGVGRVGRGMRVVWLEQSLHYLLSGHWHTHSTYSYSTVPSLHATVHCTVNTGMYTHSSYQCTLYSVHCTLLYTKLHYKVHSAVL